MPSREVNDAVGEAPTAAELLDVKELELAQAKAALTTAETRLDVAEVVRLRSIVAVLGGMIADLRARVAVEAAAEAREAAVDLDADLRRTYAKAMEKLDPDIAACVQSIKVMSAAVRKTAKTWRTAMRARFELQLVQMRFGLTGEAPEALPRSPLTHVTSEFWAQLDEVDATCRPDTLPVVTIVASDSPEQRVVKEMVAAAEFVTTYGADLKLSPDVLALFAQAGPLPASVPSRRPEPLFSGSDVPLPAGAVQSALGPTPGPSVPESPAQVALREEKVRALARSRADHAVEMAEEAARLRAGVPTATGPLKGMRE